MAERRTGWIQLDDSDPEEMLEDTKLFHEALLNAEDSIVLQGRGEPLICAYHETYNKKPSVVCFINY